MIRRPPRSTPLYSSAASDVYKRQGSQRERRSPLSGSRLRGQALRTVLLVVVGLRHGSVGLVRASRADSLILVVDFGRRVQSLLQPLRTDEWRRAPKLVHLLHFFRDLNIRLSRDLLHDELHREQRSKILGSQWIVCRRVERWWWWCRKVWYKVVPRSRHTVFRQYVLGCHVIPLRFERQQSLYCTRETEEESNAFLAFGSWTASEKILDTVQFAMTDYNQTVTPYRHRVRSVSYTHL